MKADREKKVVFYRIAGMQLNAISVILNTIISLAIYNVDTYNRELQELRHLEEILSDLKDRYEERLNEQ